MTISYVFEQENYIFLGNVSFLQEEFFLSSCQLSFSLFEQKVSLVSFTVGLSDRLRRFRNLFPEIKRLLNVISRGFSIWANTLHIKKIECLCEMTGSQYCPVPLLPLREMAAPPVISFINFVMAHYD